MKYVKMIGLLALTATALTAFASTASATELTSPKGSKLGVGTTIHAESEGATTLDGTINISCQKSTVHGKITNAGGSGSTVSGPIETLTFTECGNHTVTVSQAGTLEIHEKNGGGNFDGTLTSTGAEVTVLTHSLFLGTRHCIYVTNGTDVGTITSSDATGATATQDIDSLPIPQAATDSLCGNDAEWTGSYKINTPDSLYVEGMNWN